MGNPLVSIIIPVYNVENYIGKCVESVLAQTFIDFELLLIDDGSSDKSGKIIDEFAMADIRVVACHQQNSGASSARNYGLSRARGRWIIFIDSDDYVGERYVSDLIEYMEPNTLVIQGLTKVSEKENVSCLEYDNSTYDGHDIIKLFDSKEFFDRGFPVAKVFERNLLVEHGIKFNEHIHYSEDLIFMLEYVRNVKKIKTISGSNYFYQVNASSLTHRYNSFASEYELFESFYSLTDKIAKEKGSQQSVVAKVLSALMLMRSVYAMYVNKEYDAKERLNKIRDILLERKSLIKDFYRPQIKMFKFAKKLYLYSPILFHIFCLLKFSK